MKKGILLTCALLVCLALAACGKTAEKQALTDRYENQVDPLVIDGEEVAVKDFVIEKLREYMQREDFQHRQLP